MRFQYDREADALMISVREGHVSCTEKVDNGTLLDIDKDGLLLGIEVLQPARNWPLDEILVSHQLSEQDSQTLRAVWSGNGHISSSDVATS
jgi:uncharacterized protein YuzE